MLRIGAQGLLTLLFFTMVIYFQSKWPGKKKKKNPFLGLDG